MCAAMFAAMFAGGLVGAALYLVAGMAAPLTADLVLLALIAYVARDVIPGPARQ